MVINILMAEKKLKNFGEKSKILVKKVKFW